MANISAALVKELRERTQAGMMECKRALEAANGDLELAVEAMRKSGQAKAAKKSGRIAAEGMVAIITNQDATLAIMLEVNCETDFVARDVNFVGFVNAVAECALKAKDLNLDTLMLETTSAGKTLTQLREDLVMKLGENIHVRRIEQLTATGIVGTYVHGNRIGVMVSLSVPNKELGKDIAMHIAASKPIAIDAEDLPADLLVGEEEIYKAQFATSGKPPEIIAKMVGGRLQKFISESVLLRQPFIKDPDICVNDLLKKANAKVISFVRYEVGEGIEKKSADFASEVMAQVEGKK